MKKWILIIISVLIIACYGIIALLNNNNSLSDDENNIVNETNPYSEMNFDNEIIQQIYDEYNLYFAGIYMDDIRKGIYIKDGTPDDAIKLLTDEGIPYKLVKYNYIELFDIYKLVVSHEKFGEYGGVGMNYQDNLIEVNMPVGYVFPEEFSIYVEEGTIVLTESDLKPTFNYYKYKLFEAY